MGIVVALVEGECARAAATRSRRELLDQACHLIDLARWFLGEFVAVDGSPIPIFWECPSIDNSFTAAQNRDACRVAFLHVTRTEMEEYISRELYCRDGKLQLTARRQLWCGENCPGTRCCGMGPPETRSGNTDGGHSWATRND